MDFVGKGICLASAWVGKSSESVFVDSDLEKNKWRYFYRPWMQQIGKIDGNLENFITVHKIHLIFNTCCQIDLSSLI